jgi:hypothetical protein
MDRSVARFPSHQEAEKAAWLYYQQLSPARRLEILLELRERFQDHGDATSERLERVYRIVKLPAR